MAAAFASCSSDTPAENESESAGLGDGENFISVAIEMPTTAGSRAANTDPFEDGTANESKVDNIVFFFFDNADNCIEVQKIDNPKFENPAQPSQNPNITNYGIIEVRLKAGLKYSKVGVALNSPAQNATVLKADIKTVADYLSRTYNYADGVNLDGSGQVMSNSIYFDMTTSTATPELEKKIDVINITDKNIYSYAEKNNISQLIAERKKAYVEIFVERVMAKIVVDVANFTVDNYYIDEEDNQQVKKLTLYDHANGSSKEVVVRPVIKGMCLNVLTPRTALVKPLIIDEVGYGKGDGDYKYFEWNDPTNKRCYWATTALLAKENMTYCSWKEAETNGFQQLTQYVHPNTMDFKPINSNEGNSLNTKVMVVAELHEYEEGVDKGALDFVMYGSDYLHTSDFKNYVAGLVNRDIRNIEWNNDKINLDNITLTTEQLEKIHIVVNNAFVNETGYQSADFDLQIAETPADNQFGDEDWAAEIFLKDGISMPALSELPDVSRLLNKVTEVINATRIATLDQINGTRIMYWKGGKTYFYTNIRHKGFQGLVGNTTSDFLYGVVRNHIYKVSLTGVYGLGTPVIDSDKKINPDRPGDERPSYIKAKINILPWRVVTNTAVIH